MSTEQERADVMAEREKVYGSIHDSFGAIAKCWEGLLSMHNGRNVEVDPHMVAVMMTALKLVRSTRVFHPDNYVDGVNYIEIAEQLFEKQVEFDRLVEEMVPNV